MYRKDWELLNSRMNLIGWNRFWLLSIFSDLDRFQFAVKKFQTKNISGRAKKPNPEKEKKSKENEQTLAELRVAQDSFQH